MLEWAWNICGCLGVPARTLWRYRPCKMAHHDFIKIYTSKVPQQDHLFCSPQGSWPQLMLKRAYGTLSSLGIDSIPRAWLWLWCFRSRVHAPRKRGSRWQLSKHHGWLQPCEFSIDAETPCAHGSALGNGGLGSRRKVKPLEVVVDAWGTQVVMPRRTSSSQPKMYKLDKMCS
jgi:hypothetical protein